MFYTIVNILSSFGLFFLGIMMLGQYSAGFTQKDINVDKRSSFFSFLKSAGITALTADSRLVMFSTTSLCSSGLISFRTALVCMCGAQTTALTASFLAVIDNTILIYLILGTGGVVSFFLRKKSCKKTKTFFLFLMSIGVLLFGMNEMKESLAFIGQNSYVKTIITSNSNNEILVFIFGGILSFIMQSSGAVSFMTVGFYGSGIFTHNQAIWFLFGATCIGSAIRNQMYAFTFSGSSRRLFTIYSNRIMISALLAIAQYLFQIYTNIPMLNAIFQGIYDNIIFEVFCTFFVTDGVCTILMLMFMNPLIRIYEKILPDDKFERMSRAIYINNIDSVPKKEWLPLIKKEMAGIFEKLSEFLGIYIFNNSYKNTIFISKSNDIIINRMIVLYKETYDDDTPGLLEDSRLYEKLLALNKVNKTVTKTVNILYNSKITHYNEIIDAMLQHMHLVLICMSDFMKKDEMDSELLNHIYMSVSDSKGRKKLLSYNFISLCREYNNSFRFEFVSLYYDFLNHCVEFVKSYSDNRE